MPQAPYLRVLGSCDWLPGPQNDGACYTLSDHLLIDTGWHADAEICDAGLDFCRLSAILLTHYHADHLLGLPALLMRWRILRGGFQGLTLAGPAECLTEAFQHAHALIAFGDEDVRAMPPPRLIPLHPGDIFEINGEQIRCERALHPVPALSYCITHRATGHRIGLSGDTAYQATHAALFQNVSLLVHECTQGEKIPDPLHVTCAHHSTALDAARMANACNAQHLLLTHARTTRKAGSLQAAAQIASCPIAWAEPGQIFPY
ncbi:MAG: MBL fold metallo-hydrolase [Clostridia bacterium]